MSTNVVIPVGLATKLGVIVGALSALAALVAAIANGDHSQETLGALVLAAVNFYGVIRGRMDQAAAAIATQPSVVNSLAEPLR